MFAVYVFLNSLAFENHAKTKRIYLVRHAESEENIMYNSLKRTWHNLKNFKPPSASDMMDGSKVVCALHPSMVDSPVSENGRRQIEQVRSQLDRDSFFKNICDQGRVIVAHSPLMRAKQTCRGLFNCSADNAEFINSNNNNQANGESSISYVEIECLQELSPLEVISFRYSAALDHRARQFEDWIEAQDGDCTLIVVGHFIFFRHMLRKNKSYFENCDVYEMDYECPRLNGEAECDSLSDLSGGSIVEDGDGDCVLPRSWKSMRLVYSFQESY